MTGASKNTIAKFLVELGAACSEYLNTHLVNLNSRRIQCDEIRSFGGVLAITRKRSFLDLSRQNRSHSRPLGGKGKAARASVRRR